MRRAIVIGLVAAALVVSASVLYYEDRHWPIPQQEYANVQLSSSKDEVKYRLGIPDNVIEDECTKDVYGCNYQMYFVNGSDPKNKIPDGKTFRDFNRWTYRQKLANGKETGYVDIQFDLQSKKVTEVSCYANEDLIDNPFVCGIVVFSKSPSDLISIGTTEDDLKKKLGNPTSETVAHDSPTKTIIYKNLNLKFILLKQKVYLILVGSRLDS